MNAKSLHIVNEEHFFFVRYSSTEEARQNAANDCVGVEENLFKAQKQIHWLRAHWKHTKNSNKRVIVILILCISSRTDIFTVIKISMHGQRIFLYVCVLQRNSGGGSMKFIELTWKQEMLILSVSIEFCCGFYWHSKGSEYNSHFVSIYFLSSYCGALHSISVIFAIGPYSVVTPQFRMRICFASSSQCPAASYFCPPSKYHINDFVMMMFFCCDLNLPHVKCQASTIKMPSISICLSVAMRISRFEKQKHLLWWIMHDISSSSNSKDMLLLFPFKPISLSSSHLVELSYFQY